MRKILTIALMCALLTSCFEHNYKSSEYDNYGVKTKRQFTQVYLLWGYITIDKDRELCKESENLIFVGQDVSFLNFIFSSITGGLVDLATTKYECGVNFNKKS
jgi:hypothetical protein